MTIRNAVVMAALLAGARVMAGDVTISPEGKESLQGAVDLAPQEGAEWTRIYLKPGVYKQQLDVTRPHVALIGLGAKPDDVVITYDLSARSQKAEGSGEVGTTGSSSTFVKAPDFVASNVTFANSTPDNVAQAVAIKTQADRCVFVGCRFTGFQDTLYPTSGRCYFKDCYITGDTDFIFGNATVVFDHCTINSSDSAYVTAANTDPATKVGFVFLDCTLTASEGVPTGRTYLGRPWQWDRNKSASVTFVRTKMGPHIRAEGWHPWDVAKNTEPEKHTRYGEFGSVDLEGKALDVSQRVGWAKRLSEAEAGEYTVEKVLGGEDHWDPQKVIADVVGKRPGK